jgi:hypothetical protein
MILSRAKTIILRISGEAALSLRNYVVRWGDNRKTIGETELTRVFRTLLNGDNSQGGVRWKAPRRTRAYAHEFKLEAVRLLRLGQ